VIQFFTRHKFGRRIISKYFDVWQPLDHSQARLEINEQQPTVSSEIRESDLVLFDQVVLRATQLMKNSARSVVFCTIPDYVWLDMCQDADFDLPDYRVLALFLFWHQQGILWDSRLFHECPSPYRRGSR
jgi:hypothetical protein